VDFEQKDISHEDLGRPLGNIIVGYQLCDMGRVNCFKYPRDYYSENDRKASSDLADQLLYLVQDSAENFHGREQLAILGLCYITIGPL
jgi:hypothetical protein